MFEKALNYVKLLPKLIGVFGYAYMHPSVSIYLKATAMAGIVYFFSPMDILPDIFAPVGLIDDVILALLIMQKFLIFVPDDVLQPILDRFCITRKELLFDAEDAVKETYSATNRLVLAVRDGYDAIIDHYSKKKLDLHNVIAEGNPAVSTDLTENLVETEIKNIDEVITSEESLSDGK